MKLNLKTENELKTYIRLAMIKENINKKMLAYSMKLSYPTMLNKLQNPYKLKLTELKSMCLILRIDFNNTLNN